MITIRPFDEHDFNDIFAMIKNKFDLANLDNPNLPHPRFLDSNTLRNRLPKDLLVAVNNENIVGFIGGFFLDDIDSHEHGFLTPLALHGVKQGQNKRYVMYKLIQALSSQCVSKRIYNLAVLFHAYDLEMKHILHDLGYGGLTLDFIRGIDLIPVAPLENITLHKVSVDDLESLMPLFIGIQDHLMNSPVFLHDDDPYNPIVHHYSKQLTQGGNGLFVAKSNTTPIGYIKYTLDSINRKELDAGKTLGINGAFVVEAFRNKGVMEHLLNEVINFASTQGYTHIMTDCETANFEAVGFWSKYFSRYCYGVLRHINELKK